MPCSDELETPRGGAGGLRLIDGLGLAIFCLVLFGCAAFWGPALTLHEARLPELSREVFRNADFFSARERPPLPHWIEAAFSALLGQQCDKVWVVRLPAALAGMAGAILTAWIAGRLFGRWIGLASGFVLALTWEFYRYATLAEDDIFLAMAEVLAVALFVRAQWPPRQPDPPGIEAPAESFFGPRSWPVMGFFIALGLTNLVKGPLLGTAVVGVSIGGYMLWMRDRRTWFRYIWFFGLLVFAALALYWPIAVIRRYPTALNGWEFDYEPAQVKIEKFYYYLFNSQGLAAALAPWTPAALLGLFVTARPAFSGRSKELRFLWCWAVLPILLLSIPERKHHHYLVPSMAPWAIMATLGLREIAACMFKGVAWSRHPAFGLAIFGIPGAITLYVFRAKVPGPQAMHIVLIATWLAVVYVFYMGLWRKKHWPLLASIAGAFLVGSGYAVAYVEDAKAAGSAQDVAFLRHVDQIVPADALLRVNADMRGELYFFRNKFYLRPEAVLLHNLTYLRAEGIQDSQAYVVTRIEDRPLLEQLGTVEVLDQARPAGLVNKALASTPLFALFRVTFAANLRRYPLPGPGSVTARQAMGRDRGPFCGPPLGEEPSR